MKEIVGQVIGVLVVIVVAWFGALSLMAYGLGDIWPWHWTAQQREIHLALQMALIGVYFFATRPRHEERR